ncbi:unknown [Veillonella sp. CAG:933]|nr:unknown [Veillonella sp. CAG:933]
MYPISNLTIAKTQGTPGKGNPKIVRDRENAALGYRGITHRANGIYPYVAPEFKSDLDATYDTLTIEWDNKYLSDDNQYIKTTPLACELYVNAGELDKSAFMTALEAFIAEA